ncbi:MAG: hypothetical protein IPL35_03640 [Sphingobacteriales bacterium]|nr:hypothetical protein [Sphingobacteriales bacterium]
MTLSELLYQQQFPQFPHIPSPVSWGQYNLHELAVNKFNNFRQATLGAFTIYVGGNNTQSPEELQNYIYEYCNLAIGKFNDEGVFDTNLYLNLRIFISYDGAYLLETYQLLEKDIGSNDLAVFIEIPQKDIFSDAVLLIRAGSDIKKEAAAAIFSNKFWVQQQNFPIQITQEQVNALLSYFGSNDGFIDTLFATAYHWYAQGTDFIYQNTLVFLTKKSINILYDIADFYAKTLHIEEKYWNNTHRDYALADVAQAIEYIKEKSKTIDAYLAKDTLPAWLQEGLRIFQSIIDSFLFVFEKLNQAFTDVWALVCGFWNGLMDFISDIFSLLALLVETVEVLDNQEYYKVLVLEHLDNILQAILRIDVENFFNKFEEIWDLLQKRYNKLWNINRTEVHYYLGYAIFAILDVEIAGLLILSNARISEKIVAEIVEEINGFAKKRPILPNPNAPKSKKKSVKSIIKQVQKTRQELEAAEKNIKEIENAVKDWLKYKDKIIADYKKLREKFKSKNIGTLWKRKIKEIHLESDELKALYGKYIVDYPGLAEYFNQAIFKITIFKSGKKLDPITEYFISGSLKKMKEYFGNPPKLPKEASDILDDLDSFNKFVEGAIDKDGRRRGFDTEIKFIFNFLKKHAHKGNRFEIEITSLIKVCTSCDRELLILQEYMRRQGKTLIFIIKHNKELKNFEAVQKELNI